MRSASFLVIFAALFLTIPAQSALAQEMVEQPVYAPGDFWTYDASSPVIQEVLDELGETAGDVEVNFEFTVRVEGTEDRDIGGSTVTVYNVTYIVEVSASGSGEFTLDSNTTNITLSSTASSEVSAYLDRDGLEILQAQGTFEFVVNATTKDGGGEVTIGFEGNGTLAVTTVYDIDTWSFPLQEGNQGREESRSTGEASFLSEFLGINETQSLSSNVTALYKVEGNTSVTVPSGTFDTLVVNSTFEDEQGVPAPGYELAYWSSHAGGPVKMESYDGLGQQVAVFNLTAYRYQATERLTILGLDAIYWIPIGVGSAVLVGVVVWFLTRRGAT